MEKKKSTPIHKKPNRNIIPFPEERIKRFIKGPVMLTKEEVETCLCSLCDNDKFFLVSSTGGEIGCTNCGNLIAGTWKPH